MSRHIQSVAQQDAGRKLAGDTTVCAQPEHSLSELKTLTWQTYQPTLSLKATHQGGKNVIVVELAIHNATGLTQQVKECLSYNKSVNELQPTS